MKVSGQHRRFKGGVKVIPNWLTNPLLLLFNTTVIVPAVTTGVVSRVEDDS